MKNQKRGVTLVEIAIVLVIIGLLLGGVLKGQELINNAKVRSMADRQSAIKVAWFSFIDRYQALPGDFERAANNIPGAGDGDGDGYIQYDESVLAMQHMTAAGYLRCPTCSAVGTGDSSGGTSLSNQYGGVMSIWHNDQQTAASIGSASDTRLMVHTGPRIPSNIIYEVDRKIDDGFANTGDMVFNGFDPVEAGSDAGRIGGDLAVAAGQCMAQNSNPASAAEAEGGAIGAAAALLYRTPLATPAVAPDCGGSIYI